jgi:O-succinylbenzoate synthase
VGHVIEAVELRRVALPLVSPFRTSFGTQIVRDALLVRVLTPSGDGWGECVALAEPLYSAEFVDGAELVIRRHLLPRLWAVEHPDEVAVALGAVKGHPMAKAALELAVLDAWLRARGKSLACHLGGVRGAVDVGVSVGIAASLDALVDQVDGYVADGYRRVKLKIEPGWDVAPVRAVRERYPELPLQVDANGAYRLEDADALVALDAYELLLLEQPLAEDDLRGHAELARRVATPICLDESITSVATAVEAVESGACAIVNIKAGRVGGYLEARRIHDACLERSVPAWCGGMLETGIGRAANVALASLSGFTLPGDLSASERYFHADVTTPFELDEGRLRVPTGPGLGVDPLPERLAELTTSVELLRP